MTTSPNAANITSRRPSWNFSLRELLLLMVAVGACFALFRKEYYARQLSPFVTDLRMDNTIKEVIPASNGNPFVIVTGGIGGLQDRGITVMSGSYNLDPKLPLPTTFMRDLQAAVRENLRRNGCRISQSSNSGPIENPESFDFTYWYLNNVGTITVFFHPSEGKRATKVFVSCYEVSRSTN